MHTFADKLQTVANWVVATGTNNKRLKTRKIDLKRLKKRFTIKLRVGHRSRPKLRVGYGLKDAIFPNL